jgi:hypothetical protein
MRRRISRPSPALVISLVALFVALGGTGYAATQLAKNSVGAKQLRKGAVSSAKVKNSSLLLNDFRTSERSKLRGSPGARGISGARGATGVRGLQGPQGVQGTQGVQGDPGPEGPTGVEQVVVRSTTLVFTAASGPNGQQLSDDVQCQTGESVVGGGTDIFPVSAVSDQPNVIVNSSRPADASGATVANGEEPTGWFGSARRNSNTGGHTVAIYVLCASAGS